MKPAEYKIKPIGYEDTATRVKREIESLNTVFKKASKSPETARAFLKKAGIVDSKGQLTKKYR